MNGNNMVNKPITLLREEFIMNVSELINNSGLPPFVIEPILRDALMEVNASARRQYEYERAQYENALKNMDGELNDRRKISEETRENSTEK